MRNKIFKFLQGRYAVADDLYKFLFGIFIILILINMFFRSIYIEIIELIVVCYMFFRFFSKNVNKRYNENRKYIAIKNRILGKDIDKNHVYRRCHYCHSLLKLPLPSSIGKKEVKCPKCHKLNKFVILRKEKVVIVKKGKK